jgi:hypothetical protein
MPYHIGTQLPWGHLSGPESQCSYKKGRTDDRMGQVQLSLEQRHPHTHQYNISRGRRVLCSGGPNHINLLVFFLLGRTRTLAPPTQNHNGLLRNSAGGSVIKPLRLMAHQEGGHWFSLETVFLLLHVVIPVMMLRPHSLRLEVATVHQQFHLLRAPPLWIHSRG